MAKAREDEKKNGELKKWKQGIDRKLERKLKAHSKRKHNIWLGFGMFGLIGWSVAVPTLLGTGLGLWLDENYPRQQSWTLVLLLAGLAIGCFQAWYWIGIERDKVDK